MRGGFTFFGSKRVQNGAVLMSDSVVDLSSHTAVGSQLDVADLKKIVLALGDVSIVPLTRVGVNGVIR